jgi:hypothetical protein
MEMEIMIDSEERGFQIGKKVGKKMNFARGFYIMCCRGRHHHIFLPLNNGNVLFLNHYSGMQFTNIHPPNILGLLGCESDLQNRITM